MLSFAEWSNRSSCKAAESGTTEAYPQGTSQEGTRPRTPQVACFTILLSAGFSVVKIPMLPIQPRVTQLVGKNVSAAGDGEPSADINRFGLVIPDPVGVGVASVHFSIGQLPDRDAIAEG